MASPEAKMTKQIDREAAEKYSAQHAPVIPNHRALVRTVVAEAYLAGLEAARAAAEPSGMRGDGPVTKEEVDRYLAEGGIPLNRKAES